MEINGQNRLEKWFYRVGSWIFPSITELQIGLMYAVGTGLLILHPHILRILWEVYTEAGPFDPREILLVLVIGFLLFSPLYAILKRGKVSDYAKILATVLYFGFFAFLALGAWDSVQLATAPEFSFAWANLWLIRILLVWAILRFIISTIIMRVDDYELNRLLTQNFSDTQFRLLAFGLTAAVGIGSVLLLNNFYYDTVTVASLAFIYGGVTVSVLSRLRALTL